MTLISSVFANAIFGALAVLFFAGALHNEVNNLSLDASEKKLVLEQAANLGNAKAPIELNDKKTEIENAYHAGFISSYQKIMRICAGLGLLAAVAGLLFVRNPDKRTRL